MALLADGQNGFRTKRSTYLVNLIEAHKKLKQCTYAPLIDFRKAYDIIIRSQLWTLLKYIGISCKMSVAIKSLMC